MQGKPWVRRWMGAPRKKKERAGRGFAEGVVGAGVAARAGQKGDKKPRPNPVPTGSEGGPDRSGGWVRFTVKARSRSGCAGIHARGIPMAPPRSTQRTRRLSLSRSMARSLLSPHAVGRGDEGEAGLAPTLAHRTLPLPLSPALRGWQRTAQWVMRETWFSPREAGKNFGFSARRATRALRAGAHGMLGC